MPLNLADAHAELRTGLVGYAVAVLGALNRAVVVMAYLPGKLIH